MVKPWVLNYIPDSFSILTDAIGSFTHNYQLTVVASLYNVKAIDGNGNVVATTSFTDCDHITVLQEWAWYGDEQQVLDSNGSSRRQRRCLVTCGSGLWVDAES